MSSHYGDLRALATQWWALQRARVRLTLTVGAAKRAGWGTADDPLSLGTAAIQKAERAAARATAKACVDVYPSVMQLVEDTRGLGPAVALYLGLVPPLMRLEEFPGFPNPSALWAYSGLSAERRKKCDRRARMIAIMYLATPAILQSPDFRALYRARRALTVARGWTKAHAHRDGIRYVAKRILRALWRCRLPVGSPEHELFSEPQVTAAGALPSVVPPLDTRALLENPHEGEALAPESVGFPSEALLPAPTVTAPESAAHPVLFLSSENTIEAPESDASPFDGLLPIPLVSTPGPVVPPKLLLATIHDVTASESRA